MECERIADQLTRSINGDAWHGLSVSELLAGVPIEKLTAKPIPGAHSIWEIVLHITVWLDVIRHRLLGEAVQPTDQQDWQPVEDATEKGWRTTIDRLDSVHRELLKTIGGMTDEQLQSATPGKDDTLYIQLHGVVQHNLYHAGQIALLKKF